jgi:hypothetical protein
MWSFAAWSPGYLPIVAEIAFPAKFATPSLTLEACPRATDMAYGTPWVTLTVNWKVHVYPLLLAATERAHGAAPPVTAKEEAVKPIIGDEHDAITVNTNRPLVNAVVLPVDRAVVYD